MAHSLTQRPTISVSRKGVGYCLIYTQRDELGRDTVQHGQIYRSRDEAEAVAALPFIHPNTIGVEVVAVSTAFVEQVPSPYTARQLQRLGYA